MAVLLWIAQHLFHWRSTAKYAVVLMRAGFSGHHDDTVSILGENVRIQDHFKLAQTLLVKVAEKRASVPDVSLAKS